MVPEAATNVTVTMEPSDLDTSHMKIEDFTSQRLEEKQEFVTDLPYGAEVSIVGASGESHSEFAITRPTKRKRKAPSVSDESPPHHAHVGGWVRSAMG